MKNSESELRPTIWRTVRAAMNPTRLNLLRTVLFSSGREFTVSDLARMFEIDQPIATNYLRQLNARGLIGVARGRIKVYYNSELDRSLPDSVEMQAAFKECLAGRQKNGWERELIRIMKPYAHFNRLAMITRLAEGPSTIDDFHKAIGGCVKSVYHHVAFLQKAGLIEARIHYHQPTQYVLVPQRHILARTLLRITLLRKECFSNYWNPPLEKDNDAATEAVLRKVAAAESK